MFTTFTRGYEPTESTTSTAVQVGEQDNNKKKTIHNRLLCASKLVSVIHVRVVVFGDHHSVGKLAASQRLHSFLTLCSRDVLHKDLKSIKQISVVSTFSIEYSYLNISEVKGIKQKCSVTFPQPGTSTPSTGRGISMEQTLPYLQHSSRMSSRISS